MKRTSAFILAALALTLGVTPELRAAPPGAAPSAAPPGIAARPGAAPSAAPPGIGAPPPASPGAAGEPSGSAPGQPGAPGAGAPSEDPAGGRALPPGHPAVGADARATPGMELPPPSDSVPVGSLPRGTIVVQAVDADSRPLPGLTVRLGKLHQTISEGESRTAESRTSGADGTVRFDGLGTGTDMSYSVAVPYGEATYGVAPFNLRTDMGQLVTVRVYPVTSDIREATVGMRGVVYIEPRDDVFQLEVMFRLFNIGKNTWVPKGLVLELPSGWKAFNTQDSTGDVRVAASGERGVELLGTVAPGQHDVSFRFQLPNPHDTSYTTTLALPPHLAELRVIALSSPGMELEVAGMSPGESGTNERGERILFTGRQLARGEPQMKELSLTLRGIPTPGIGRWVAVAVALALVVGGVGVVASRERFQRSRHGDEDFARARDLILDELVALEKSKEDGGIGPKLYASTRRELFDALTRLEARLPSAGPARKSGVKSKRSESRSVRSPRPAAKP
ncbi:MAG: carboxypeptidase-like regulatory domain-containing protein [Polyangiaceae bacterium]|nr:carboxypeptidase-like regulatory domain-containing protein [Polyangiaceae bacterium]